ncbi:hypothetical protein [Vannielia litorea]|uniref:hypothetical protein n=1 Tax=Vannielia TaxID=2813041 RepID=UPI001C985994|nr:hypothetical protein [Vannielia litorea]MBY6049394.1 hypothetical protein [Vannielia litorea]MBY6076808.1 hypothetical protein [Vannielia litorea]
MPDQSVQAVAKHILSLGDVEVADFIRCEVSHKRLSSKLHLLNDGVRRGNSDSRELALQAIERLGFV